LSRVSRTASRGAPSPGLPLPDSTSRFGQHIQISQRVNPVEAVGRFTSCALKWTSRQRCQDHCT
jgi:hypothetical protein